VKGSGGSQKGFQQPRPRLGGSVTGGKTSQNISDHQHGGKINQSISDVLPSALSWGRFTLALNPLGEQAPVPCRN